MAWFEAFVPIDARPPCRPDPHPSSRRMHVRTRAEPGRSTLFAQTTPARAHTRTRPGQHGRCACTNEPGVPYVRTRSPHRHGRSAPTNPPRARPNPTPPLRPAAVPASRHHRTLPDLAALGLPSRRGPCSTVRHSARRPLPPRQRRPRLHGRDMGWCEAFDPSDERPPWRRTHPQSPVARTREPCLVGL
jgi:hypothetical protein